MRGSRGTACAGELTVLRSRFSACHRGILNTLYIRLPAAPLVVDYNKNGRDLQQHLVQLPDHFKAE